MVSNHNNTQAFNLKKKNFFLVNDSHYTLNFFLGLVIIELQLDLFNMHSTFIQ